MNWFISILVYWHIGTLAHWHIGVLVYWCIGVLVYWFIGTLTHWEIGKLANWHIDLDIFGALTILQLTFVCKAVISSSGNDDVIQQPHTDGIAAGFYFLGDL